METKLLATSMWAFASVLSDDAAPDWSGLTRLIAGSAGFVVAVGSVLVAIWLIRWHLAHRDNGQLSLLPLGLAALFCLLLAMVILIGTAATNSSSPGGAIISTP